MRLNLLNNFLRFLIVILLCNGRSFSQNFDEVRFFKDGSNYYGSILKINQSNAKNYVFSAGAITGSLLLDSQIKNFVNQNRNGVYDIVFGFEKRMPEVLFSSSLLIYLHGTIYDNNKNRDLGFRLAESMFFSGTITTLIKMVSGRTRAYATNNPYEFSFFEIDWEKTSFPSGHATIGFAFSTVMANETESVSGKVLWYSLATVIALSRVYNEDHWLSDIVFGSLIGYFTGQFFSKPGEKYDETIIPPISFTIPF